jgi:hypothetical protein
MGFYLRKTVKVGGINLNLSGSGLGISTGVKGFRVGMNGRGTYVQMGRGGLYYRKQISWQRTRPSTNVPRRALEAQVFADQSIIFSENLAQPMALGLADSGDSEVLKHFRATTNFGWIWLAGVGAVIALAISPYVSLAIIMASTLGVIVQSAMQQKSVLMYDLDGLALERYEAFVNSFGDFFTSDRLWLYEHRAVTTDWKRNAGATNLLKRRAAEVLPSGDPKIKTNVSIPCLKSGGDAFYFLPDLIVVRSGANIRSFGYSDLTFSAVPQIFIEEQGVPRDTVVVGHTWKFVRKDGGPDRRFNNNRQLPKCQYQAVHMRLGDAFDRTFSKSRVAQTTTIQSAFSRMTEVIKTLRVVNDLAALPKPHH